MAFDVSSMKKESGRRHHFVPRSYLRRFAVGKKHRLHVQEIKEGKVMRDINPNVTSFLVECGIYDLNAFRMDSPNFTNVEDGFLEDLVFAQIHEPLYSKSLKNSIDLDLVPDVSTCKGIIQGVWTLYLRTPRIRRINAEIAKEVDLEIDDNRRKFLNSFGMVTAKTILKLFPKTLVHTRSILFNAVGVSGFLTTDHPSIPCFYDDVRERISRCNEHQLQRSVILADEWPNEVALLCPLSPRWCILTWSVQELSSVQCKPIESEMTERLNLFIRENAERFVILPPPRR